MRQFERIAAQGDLLLIRVDEMPDGMVKSAPVDGKHVLAHSETGHHHTVDAADVVLYDAPGDPLDGAMRVLRKSQVTHERGFDQHESIGLDPGFYRVRRQREHTPEGYRRAQD